MIIAAKLGIGLFLATTALSGAALAQDWTGPYVGVEASGAAIDSQTTRNFGTPVFSDAELSGFLFGIEAGYNMQLDNNLVLGIAGDWAISTVDGDGLWYASDPFRLDLNSLATLQAKLGLAVGPTNRTLVFLSGGLALADVDLSGYPVASSKNHLGFVISAGVEHMLTEAVSIKADVSYVNLGKETYNPGEVVKLDGIMGTVGVNFHF